MLDFSTFDWATAPLHRIEVVIATAVLYVWAALTAKLYLWKHKVPATSGTSRVLAAHSLVLCVGSLWMCAGAIGEIRRRVADEGVAWFFCESQDPPPRLYAWAYAYYLSKYYELLDTVLQLFKGRPPPHFFLHVYHHAVVLLMAWNWLEYVQTLQHIALLFNTSVHVVMYYYYFRRVLGWPVWWKRYVTQFQLVQFGSSAACGVVTLYLVAVRGDACAGKGALLFNFAFNMTLMYQFFGVLGPKPKAKSK